VRAAPQAARTDALSLRRQVRLRSIRCAADEKQPATLREQAAAVHDPKAEIAEPHERLCQNSSNSSSQSSDAPSYKRKPPQEPKGRGVRHDGQGSERLIRI
jgi:hypothetical protein